MSKVADTFCRPSVLIETHVCVSVGVNAFISTCLPIIYNILAVHSAIKSEFIIHQKASILYLYPYTLTYRSRVVLVLSWLSYWSGHKPAGITTYLTTIGLGIQGGIAGKDGVNLLRQFFFLSYHASRKFKNKILTTLQIVSYYHLIWGNQRLRNKKNPW